MKVLVAIAHFFRPDAEGRYASTREGMAWRRKRALQHALLGWRGHFQETVTPDFPTRTSRAAQGPASRIDIVAVVHGNDHLLTPDLQQLLGVSKIEVGLRNPRALPFAVHELMADRAAEYDWFIYSEDDLVVRDPLLLHKLVLFQDRFGPGRVLQPNRYELNPFGTRPKTYIDGDPSEELTEGLFAFVEEKERTLSLEDHFGVTFERARNPHSGFFALSQQQLVHWTRQKHFLDHDSSFISPLESAATLGLAKTFAIFKARAPLQGWFEIEHGDDRYSRQRWPLANAPAA